MSDATPTSATRAGASAPEPAALSTVRRILLGVLALGLVGTGVELLLLEHWDGAWQMVPLVLFALALVTTAWHAADRRATSLRVLRVVMLLLIAGGAAGLMLHYRGNVEFELETTPTLRGLALFARAMMGATPALAPGAMIQTGLIGLAYAYRHPALRRSDDR
jgi:hypothetical protein